MTIGIPPIEHHVPAKAAEDHSEVIRQKKDRLNQIQNLLLMGNHAHGEDNALIAERNDLNLQITALGGDVYYL